MVARTIYRSDSTVPASDAILVTPDDSNELAIVTRAVYVGNAGNLHVTFADGGEVTLVNAAAGWHPIAVRKIWYTGTSANNIIAAW